MKESVNKAYAIAKERYAAIGVIANYGTGMTGEVTDLGIGEVMSAHRDAIFEFCFDLVRLCS